MDAQDPTRRTITRQEAINASQPHYFTGIPCVNGHLSIRSVKTRQCLACNKANMAKMRAADPARIARDAAKPKPVPIHPIISRRDARTAGLLRYFTGVPCKNGHLSERITLGKQCLACHRDARTKFRANNPDLVRYQKAKSYLAHREKVISKVKQYIENNADIVFLRRSAYRAAHKERLAAINAKWRAENRDISRVHERTRRARKKSAEGTHSLADIRHLETAQKMLCAAPWCRISLAGGYHVDHIMPLARGGSNWPTNLQLLCEPCNQSKGAHDPAEWARINGHLL